MVCELLRNTQSPQEHITYAALKRQHDVRNKKTELGVRTGASKCQT